MLEKANAAMNAFDNPKLLGNLFFALPAIGFGLLWYTEKTTGSYILLVLSVVFGVFLITWGMVTRLQASADVDNTERELDFIGKMATGASIQDATAYLSKGVILAIVIWFGLLLYSIWIVFERVTNPTFAIFFLFETIVSTCAISAFFLKQKILDAGKKVIGKIRASEKK